MCPEDAEALHLGPSQIPSHMSLHLAVHLNPLKNFKNYLLLILFFWPQYMARGILVPQPGIKPGYPGLEAQSHLQLGFYGGLLM